MRVGACMCEEVRVCVRVSQHYHKEMKKGLETRSHINFSHSILVLLPGRKIHQRQKEWASVCGGAWVSACDRDLEKERGVGTYEYSFESPVRLNLDLAKKLILTTSENLFDNFPGLELRRKKESEMFK